jgi:energy-coupling factor transporter ATP-binding protein EcfA2
MTKLIAKEFRIQNYRNVDDSGWIPIETVTALVGRNESGKTALLKALHKFNPATPQPYVPQREFPRDRFTRDFRNGGDWPVSSVKFSFDEELRKILAAITAPNDAPEFVVPTRFYNGTIKYALEPELKETEIPPGAVLAAIDSLSDAAMRLAPPAPEQEESYDAIRKDLLAWTTTAKERVAEHKNLKSPVGAALLAAIHEEAKGKGRPETANAVQAFLAAIDEPKNAAAAPPVLERVIEEVKKHLPVFIYFDNYGVLDSAIYLPRLIEDLALNPTDPKVRTIDAMFKHVQLTAKEISELGHSQARETRIKGAPQTPEMIREDQERMELRSIKLNSASNDITARFSAWWKQRRHTIRYHADGDFFRIWVADDRRPGIEIELESRSGGFQWFFSFYLVFLVESEEAHKEAMLLLDEPGLHLHPTAQQELIAFFEELSQKNQLIYTTHSPFLIDGEHLHRVRPVTEDDTGHSRVSIGTWPKDRETIFPLQAAAGYAMVRGLFQHAKNVLVEGMSEYFYLYVLSILCRASGRTALPDDVYITPCGGTSMVAKIAALFLGQQVRPVVLLDGDQAARVQRDNLMRELYVGHDQQILMLDSILGVADCEIEDLLGEAAILPVLNTELLPTAVIIPMITPADRVNSGVVNHIKAAAARLGIELPEGWKPETARRLAAVWSLKRPEDLPADVLDRAATLFGEIRRRF